MLQLCWWYLCQPCSVHLFNSCKEALFNRRISLVSHNNITHIKYACTFSKLIRHEISILVVPGFWRRPDYIQDIQGFSRTFQRFAKNFQTYLCLTRSPRIHHNTNTDTLTYLSLKSENWENVVSHLRGVFFSYIDSSLFFFSKMCQSSHAMNSSNLSARYEKLLCGNK